MFVTGSIKGFRSVSRVFGDSGIIGVGVEFEPWSLVVRLLLTGLSSLSLYCIWISSYSGFTIWPPIWGVLFGSLFPLCVTKSILFLNDGATCVLQYRILGKVVWLRSFSYQPGEVTFAVQQRKVAGSYQLVMQDAKGATFCLHEGGSRAMVTNLANADCCYCRLFTAAQ